MVMQGFGKLTSLKEARSILAGIITKIPDEQIPLDQALNRVLAEDIIAELDVPHFRKSAMDGYAVMASDTFGATSTSSKKLQIVDSVVAGVVSEKKLDHGECIEITTGAPLPDGADAVVMVEYTEKEDAQLSVNKSSAPWDNVIHVGSDVKKGSLVLKKGTCLRPRFTGVLAALGRKNVLVKKVPRIGMLSTGDELLSLEEDLVEGKVFDINSRTLIDSIKEMFCLPVDLGIVGDDKDLLKKKILEGVERSDIMIISGGSSLGTEDLTQSVVEDLGEVLVHGIAVKPGKPVIIGQIKGKVFVGLPGYPTSALSDFHILVKPVVQLMLEMEEIRNFVEAKLARKIFSTVGRYEFLAVKLETGQEGMLALPVMKGSSSITTLSSADGFVEIDENTEVLNRGSLVKVGLF
ncbi:gephyrin-like molybdotransferase Glp [Acidobacteriota bacterium]